jgi:GTP-binding protein
VDGDRQFVMADIPGLIEGAHAGAGLGHEFLRHIERAGILVHLVEPLPADESDPIENYHVIREELAQYDEQLAERPEIVVVSKAELPGADDVANQLADTAKKEVLLISSVTGQGLNQLVRQIADLLEVERQAT